MDFVLQIVLINITCYQRRCLSDMLCEKCQAVTSSVVAIVSNIYIYIDVIKLVYSFKFIKRIVYLYKKMEMFYFITSIFA